MSKYPINIVIYLFKPLCAWFSLMENEMKKLILIYAIEIAIAAAILWYDQRLFFLYFFAIVMIQLDRKARYLDKVIRVYDLSDELRVTCIVRHLKISDEEIEETRQELLKKLTPEQEERLLKISRDVWA